jgi:dipeptidase E
VARLLLASRGIPGLGDLLQAPGDRAVLVPTAAAPLGDPGIAEEVERELAGAGLRVTRLELGEASSADVRARVSVADVITVSGGDPFHLLAEARRSGFADAVREALGAGAVYVGYSAGAMVAGPTLEPLLLTSPFSPPTGLDVTGLGLADVLVLPHHGRPGRAERHAAAQAEFGSRVRLEPLSDGELVIQDGTRIRLVR